MSDLRYPVGKFVPPETITAQELQNAIDAIAVLPSALRQAVENLDEKQLDTPYRPEGWTVRQVVHHLADSHMNAFIRMRKALAEEEPAITGYDEKAWAGLDDSRQADPELSLTLLESLHHRWALMLRSLSADEWQRAFRHPERGKVRLDTNTLMYAWHGRHHVAHITNLRNREGW